MDMQQTAPAAAAATLPKLTAESVNRYRRFARPFTIRDRFFPALPELGRHVRVRITLSNLANRAEIDRDRFGRHSVGKRRTLAPSWCLLARDHRTAPGYPPRCARGVDQQRAGFHQRQLFRANWAALRRAFSVIAQTFTTNAHVQQIQKDA